MIILETLGKFFLSMLISILVLYILFGIGAFFDWIEYKIFEKGMNEYLERKHKQESLRRYDYDLHLQYMMREWNW